MATDVIIDPSTGQIYWNDSAGVGTESISIKGDAVNTISFTGYSASFSPGSTPAGALTLVTIKDSAGTDALIPGTSGYNLGSATLRWNTFATNADLSGTLVVSSATNSSSTTTGALKVSGGVGIVGNAFIGGTINVASPITIPNGGTNASSFGQSAGFIYYDGTSVRLLAASGATINYTNGYYQFDNRVYATSFFANNAQMPNGSGVAGRVTIWSGNNTIGSDADFTYDSTNNILNVSGNINAIGFTASGVAITSGTASTSTTTGALVVSGGVGISGRLSFNQAAFGTTGITTVPTMAMIGQTGDPIYMSVLEDNSISFEGSQGQLFSISPNLTTGYIWSVNDISGVPFLRASVGGTIGIAEFGGVLGIGQTNPKYKLDLKGSFGLASSNDALYNFIFNNSAASGSNNLQIRSANSILFYNSGNTFYTGFKSNASADKLYVLPATDGSSGQFLQTDGAQNLSWATASGGGGGSGSTGVNPGGQYQVGYYASTGSSIDGSSTFTNNTVTGVIAIGHATVSTNFANGALIVTGGVGIGGSLYVGGIGASISGVRISTGAVVGGAWNATPIAPQYGGTGLNNLSATGLLQYSSGTASVITTSSALASIISDETGTAGKLVFSTSPTFTTSVVTDSTSFDVYNTTATTINAFGAALTLNFGAATGKATFNSTDNSISATTGGLVISGGAGIAKSVSVGGYLQLFSGANYTAFVSSASGNTVYTLPATSPATGTSVLQSTSAGVMSWVPMVASSSGAGSGTVAIPDAQFRLAYYAGTGASVSSLSLISAVGTGVTILGATNASSTRIAALSILGGLGVTGNAFIGGTVTIQDSTVSASTTTGALVVAGGIGAGGKVFADVLQSGGNTAVGGNLTVAGDVDLGNAIADSISFLGRIDTDLDPILGNTYDFGVPELAWRNASFGSSLYFTNTTNTNILAFTAGATGTTLTYVLPIDTPTTGQVLAASVISGGRVTLSWEDDQTGAPAGGITSLNSQTGSSQSLATGTSGTDFAISSVTNTHTFNLPDAGSSARGVVSTGTQTLAGAKTFSSALTVSDSTTSISTTTGALKITGGVGIGGSLYTSTGSSSSVSGVILANGNVSATTYNKLTLTAPATSATLTLANGSSLITSGGHSLTFNTTATTSLTLPTTGTLATTDVTSLASLTTASSLNSVGTIGTGIWNGTVIAPQYGGTGQNYSASSGILKYTTGTASLVTAPTGAIVGTTDSQNLTNKTYNSVTITAPASSATLTLANSSSLITSGGHSLTFNTTATTSITLPTAGTLATTSNKLSDFAATTSAEFINTITGETGTGALVFATSPDFTTSVTTPSTTFSVFNATASTVNAFGAATVMSIGAVTGKATFNSTDNSISATTGGLVVSGGAGVAKSVSIGGRLQMFNGANYTAFVSAASGDVVYTLPPTVPAGVGSSYLSASTTGVMAWVAAPTSGGSATPGGNNKQIQYNSSNTFAGASGFEYTTGGIAVTVSVFSPSGTGYTSGLWVSAIGGTTRVGIGLSNPQFELEILGEISATNKSFVINHPTKSGMKLRYGSLEGPENGVYVRGELKNSNIIEVPDHWIGLVHEDSYTVHLTPISRYAQLYVEKIENYNVFILDANMNPIHCYYSVWAERKDIPKLVTEYEAQ